MVAHFGPKVAERLSISLLAFEPDEILLATRYGQAVENFDQSTQSLETSVYSLFSQAFFPWKPQ